MDNLALIHVLAITFWLGVISVEVIFERAKIDQSATVVLHKLTDRYIELPIITVVMVTGLMLWSRTGWSIEILPKVLVGMGAVLSNVICYYFVEKRTPESSVFSQQSKNILWITVPGFICFIAAFLLGTRLI